MASKYLFGTYTLGYTLSGTYTSITIGTTAAIGGAGLLGGTAHAYTILNLGSVTGGVTLQDGGTITNGSTGVTTALVAGGNGTAGSSGHLASAGGSGVDLTAGGNVVNFDRIIGGQGGAGSGFFYYGGGGEGGAGVSLSAGGTITNAGLIAGGDGGAGEAGILGGYGGIGISSSDNLSVINSGTVTGGNGGAGSTSVRMPSEGGGVGILLLGTGGITNSGLIIGGTGGAPVTGFSYYGGNGGTGVGLIGGSIANTGTIAGGSAGAGFAGRYSGGLHAIGGGIKTRGGIITNGSPGASTALIQGKYGIYATTGTVGTTVVDFGTIASTYGTSGVAMQFFDSGANLLALGNGYKLIGTVQGVRGTNTLELLGSAGNAVRVNYNRLGLTNFQDVLFGAGGNATFDIENTSGTLGVVISGFTASSDTIDLTALGTPVGHTRANNQLTVSGSEGTVMFKLDASDSSQFSLQSDGVSGTNVMIACFCRGTLILTEHGEVPVEALPIGDTVMTLSGEARPIRWIGHRAYDGRFIAGNRDVLPIRVMAGALADGVPARDLWLSPEHSLYLGGVLAQAKHLVNGATVIQADDVEQVEYFHIELETHDILFADGAPAETYVDCDNRLMFANGAEYDWLYPKDDRPTWDFCCPRLEWEDAELTEIRAALFSRAAALGHAVDTDPDLHLVVDGEVLRPDTVAGGRYRFAIPAGCRAAWLASRRTVPAEIVAASRDARPLGVAVERVALYDADLSIEAWHGHAALSEGFHDDEPSHRWTDGMARLPDVLLRPFPGDVTLDVHVIQSELGYRLPAAAGRAATRSRRRRRTAGAR